MKIWPLLLILITCYTGLSVADVSPMPLRGKGDLRYFGFIKVYDAYLYTPQPEDTGDILSAGVSKCLRLDYAVSLSSEDFIASADTILKKQHGPERLRLIQPQLNTFNSAYQAVKKGDQYRLCYDAATYETTLLLNDEPLVTIASAEFGSAYFGIWLGEKHPIDAGLRGRLLNIND